MCTCFEDASRNAARPGCLVEVNALEDSAHVSHADGGGFDSVVAVAEAEALSVSAA